MSPQNFALFVVGVDHSVELPFLKPDPSFTFIHSAHTLAPLVPAGIDGVLVRLQPETEGFDSLAALARLHLDAPLIAVSDARDEMAAVRALGVGADEHVTVGELLGGSLRAILTRAAARRKAAAERRKGLSNIASETNEANARLSAANEELRIFSQTVAHDLGSPLSQIALYAELLEKELTEREGKPAHYGRRIRAAAQRAATLLDSLYITAKSGLDSEPMCEVDLGGVLQNVLADFESRLQTSAARIVPGRLPTVQARASQMYQVLANLVDNALKHASSAPPMIEVNAVALEREWVVSVKDNGLGISEEHWQSIFEPYRRLAAGHRTGFGIGLWICRKIVEAHGGRIWVNSAPGNGATFFFTLPMPIPAAV